MWAGREGNGDIVRFLVDCTDVNVHARNKVSTEFSPNKLGGTHNKIYVFIVRRDGVESYQAPRDLVSTTARSQCQVLLLTLRLS